MNEIYWDVRTRQLAIVRERLARQERRAQLRARVMDALGAALFFLALIFALNLEAVPGSL